MMHRHQSLPAATHVVSSKRVAMARAVINNPKLILADEPPVNLEAQQVGMKYSITH